MMTDRKELKDEELGKVTGGSIPNPKELGSKYQKDTKVKYYSHGWVQTTGTIQAVEWDDNMNQYVYKIDHERTRYIILNDEETEKVRWLDPGTDIVKEEDIIYDL